MPMPTRKAEQSVLNAIGQTPMVRLNHVAPPDGAEVYIKLEYYNPTGSYKDRMALSMIEGAEARGELKPGMTVVEYTSGSTGSSLAFVCGVKGYPLVIVSSDAFAKEKLQAMAILGAELDLVPSDGGKVSPALFAEMERRARELAAARPGFMTNQFHNPDAEKGFESLGREIVEQFDGPIHGFVGAVGTAGMLMGVAHVLRERTPRPWIVALEPASSPIITQGVSGSHHVDGVGAGHLPPLLDKAYYDEARAIEEAEAREMARRLAREEGIFAGTSTGMNVAGAVALARELGPGHTVVTVAVDSGLKYLAGDLFNP